MIGVVEVKKKYIIIIVIVTLINILISLNGILFKEKPNIIEENINTIKKDDRMLSMMLETAHGSGNYEMTTRSEWPTDGYKFNTELSKCENGGELSWDDTNKTVLMTGNTSDRCYIYFDKLEDLVTFYYSDEQYTVPLGITWKIFIKEHGTLFYPVYLNAMVNDFAAFGSWILVDENKNRVYPSEVIKSGTYHIIAAYDSNYSNLNVYVATSDGTEELLDAIYLHSLEDNLDYFSTLYDELVLKGNSDLYLKLTDIYEQNVTIDNLDYLSGAMFEIHGDISYYDGDFVIHNTIYDEFNDFLKNKNIFFCLAFIDASSSNTSDWHVVKSYTNDVIINNEGTLLLGISTDFFSDIDSIENLYGVVMMGILKD